MNDLNQYEKQAIEELHNLYPGRDPSSKQDLLNAMIKIDNVVKSKEVNWLKVAIALDNKKMIDCVFYNYPVNEQLVQNAVDFAAAQDYNTSQKTIDKIATGLVQRNYEVKHAQMSPESNLPDSMKDYKTLTTIEYFKEKFKDFFAKKIDTKNKISELRERFNSKRSDNTLSI